MCQIKILALLLFFFEKSFSHEIYEKHKKCDFRDEARQYGRTSDRELFDPNLDIVTAKSAIDFEKSDFYDPSYGFSKEAIASLGVYDKLKSSSEIAALETENQKRPATTYQRHVYTKYPDIDKGIKSLLKPVAQSIPLSSNPLKYLRSFVEKTPSDSKHASSHEHESVVNTDLAEYEQYFKKLNEFNRPGFDENFKGFKPTSDESDLGHQIWQAGADAGGSQRQFFDFSKLYEDDSYKRYASQLYEQQRAVGEYLSKFSNSAEYDLGSSEVEEDYDSSKFRDNRKPRRGRRPGNIPRSKSRGLKPSTACVGPRCSRKVRRPRFTPF